MLELRELRFSDSDDEQLSDDELSIRKQNGSISTAKLSNLAEEGAFEISKADGLLSAQDIHSELAFQLDGLCENEPQPQDNNSSEDAELPSEPVIEQAFTVVDGRIQHTKRPKELPKKSLPIAIPTVTPNMPMSVSLPSMSTYTPSFNAKNKPNFIDEPSEEPSAEQYLIDEPSEKPSAEQYFLALHNKRSEPDFTSGSFKPGRPQGWRHNSSS